MRKAVGYALVVLSFVAWAAIAALPVLDVSIGSAAAITTTLVISGEVAFFAGVALLGKEAWNKVKSIFKKK